jgi:hypothetical protein
VTRGRPSGLGVDQGDKETREEGREDETMPLKNTVDALLRDSKLLSREGAKLRQMAEDFMHRADALQRDSEALRQLALARKRKQKQHRR